MSKQLQATCDKCGKVFNVDYKIKRLPNKIQEHYFKCEHCFFHYTTFVTDAKARKMQKKLRSLMGTGARWEQLHQELSQRMGKLKYNLLNFGRADL